MLKNELAEKIGSSQTINTELMALITHYINNPNEKKYCLDETIFSSQIERNLIKDRYEYAGEKKFTFIDLFAGIGGFRIAMQKLGGKCVFSSEWDSAAQETYFANFGDVPFGDITRVETKNMIPNHFDILCAGFPCQPFSYAGQKKGFNDPTKGTLFFDVCEILKTHRPKAFSLKTLKESYPMIMVILLELFVKNYKMN